MLNFILHAREVKLVASSYESQEKYYKASEASLNLVAASRVYHVPGIEAMIIVGKGVVFLKMVSKEVYTSIVSGLNFRSSTFPLTDYGHFLAIGPDVDPAAFISTNYQLFKDTAWVWDAVGETESSSGERALERPHGFGMYGLDLK